MEKEKTKKFQKENMVKSRLQSKAPSPNQQDKSLKDDFYSNTSDCDNSGSEIDFGGDQQQQQKSEASSMATQNQSQGNDGSFSSAESTGNITVVDCADKKSKYPYGCENNIENHGNQNAVQANLNLCNTKVNSVNQGNDNKQTTNGE